jgi:hypothetical protein
MRGLPAPAATALLPKSMAQQHLRAIAIAAILAVIIIDMAFPNSPQKRWLFLLPLAALWAFVVLKALVGQRQ